MITIQIDFNTIEKNGKLKLAKELIAKNVTEGTLIILSSPSAHTPKFATLYQTDEDFYYLRIQD